MALHKQTKQCVKIHVQFFHLLNKMKTHTTTGLKISMISMHHNGTTFMDKKYTMDL